MFPYRCNLQMAVLLSYFLPVDLALHFSGTVLSCAGAPGKVLVPGGGNDDLLSSAEPAVDNPVQSEQLEVRVCLLCLHDTLAQMSDKKNNGGVRFLRS